MNSRFASMVVVALFAFAIGSQVSVDFTVGQEKAAEHEKAAPVKVAKKPRGRLPAYYAQIGLSTEQRDQIYKVQSTYRKQIDELQKQIDALKKKQDAEVVAVLKPEQKEKLETLLAAAKKRAEERRSKNKARTKTSS
jgi:Spy/CpxP family protein refolding chaperone